MVRSQEGRVEELRAMDERLLAIMRTTSDPMFMKDREGRYMVANPALLRILGRDLEDVVGRSDVELQFDPATGREIMAMDRQVMDANSDLTVEEVVRTREGCRTFQTTRAPLHDERGMVIGLTGTARDITDRKRAEEALKESEAKYRGLFENTQDIAAVLRYELDDRGKVADWTLEDANPPALKALGAGSLSEVAGKRMSEVARTWDLPPLMDITDLVRMKSAPFIHGRHIEGISKDYILTFIPLERGRFILTATDITEIKTAQRRLEEKRARLRAIVDNLPVGVAIADTEGRIVEVNRMTEQIWGVGPGDMDGGGQGPRKAGAERPQTERDRQLDRALKGETVINEEYDIERGDGSVGTIISSAAPIMDPRGKIIGALSTVVDITERRALEKDLAEAKSRAETYVDVLTHDVNNYNTAAMGYLQLAEMRLHLEEDDMKYITKPLEVLEDSTELIANVRDLQRLEAGRNGAGTVDVCRMLKEVKEAFEDPPGREVVITLDAPDHCPAMTSGLLRNAFSNIVSNAIKHSAGPLDVNIRMDFEPVRGEDGIRISIEDNGPGIPDERKKVIFDRSLMGLTRTVSRGLGLYFVKRLVEDLGGEVWAEDRVPGDHTKGARFVMRLPLRQDTKGDA